MLQFKKNSDYYMPRHAIDKLKNTMYLHELLIGIGFFFLSLARWFGMPLFLGIPCALSMHVCGMPVYGALAGSAVGCLYQWLWGESPFWWITVTIACLPLLRGITWKKDVYLMVAGAVFMLPGVFLFGIQHSFTTQEWILSVLQTIGCSYSISAINKGICWLKNNEGIKGGSDDVLCLTLPVLTIISGMANTHIWQVDLGYVFSIVLLYVIARILSVSASIGTGFCLGLTLLLSGHGIFWCVFLPLAGAIISWTKLSNRMFGVLLIVLGVLFTSFLLYGWIWTEAMFSSFAAILVCLLLPNSCIRKATLLLQTTTLFQRADNSYLEDKLRMLTQSLHRLSHAIPCPCISTSKQSNIAEELMESICDGCEQMMWCWHDSFEDRKKEFEEIENKLMWEGNVSDPPVSCCRVQLAEKTMRSILKREQEKAVQMKRVQYEQEMLITHFSALSSIVEESIHEGISSAEEDAYLVRQVDEVLKTVKFPGRALFVKLENGHYRIGIQKLRQIHAAKEFDVIVKHIGNRLQRELRVSSEDDKRYIIEEIPRYHLSVGKSTACAVSAERKSITPYAVENGDAVIYYDVRNGLSIVALSDGMGHGDGAGKESAKTLELLSICLEAGYTRSQAITAVNGLMLSSANGERFATVDLCTFDLWNGNMTVNKLGAANSLVIQGQHINLIEGEALPLGIIEHIVPTEHSTYLTDGDMVLLFSDGVTDAFKDEGSLAIVIKRYIHLNPQQISDSILQDALIQSGGLPKDDMTVVCIRLENRLKSAHAKRSA